MVGLSIIRTHLLMKKALILLITLTLFKVSYNQNDNLFHSFKWGAFSEYAFTPTGVSDISVRSTYNESTKKYEDALEYGYSRYASVSMFNFIYAFRYNLLEPSDNFGVGINASPSLGLAVTDDGYLSLNLPVYLTANFGTGSTYNTTSNMGGYIGIGYEFNKIGLIGSGDGLESEVYINGSTISTPTDVVEIKTAWLQPMLIAGIRWWSKSNRLKEFSFKYGFGTNSDLPDNAPKTEVKTPNSIQISYGWFINY